MINRTHKHTHKKGFTIVELLVVIVVIGILATIVGISFGAWRKNATTSQLKSDLNGASSAMENERNFGSGYPTVIPTSFQPSSGVILSGGGLNGGKGFCITATSGIQSFNISQYGFASAGVCPVVYLDASVTASYPRSGTSWTDLSGNSINASLMNGVGYTGNNSGALLFDGVDDYISAPDNTNLHLGIGDFTVSFWCYRTAIGYQGGSYVVKGPYGTPGFETYDSLFFVNTINGNLARIGLSAGLNVWENHTLVVNQSSSPYIKHYINGVLNQSGYAESGYRGSIDSSSSLIIGKSTAGGPARYFNGSIGSFHVYNKALNDSEVQQEFDFMRSRFGI